MYSANAKIAAYRKVQVHTADRGKVLLMLYDGAIRFLGIAKESMENKEIAKKGEHVSKVYAILIELQASLNHETAPELCRNLHALYQFMMDRLVHSNIHNDAVMLDEICDLLITLREGWERAVKGTGLQPLPTASLLREVTSP